MKESRIREILGAIKKVRVAVYGDFCLDAYWIMDPRGSEVSEETGLRAEAVKRHYYSPGGASNIAANLAALRPAEIRAIGVIGDDIFGRELLAQLKSLDVHTDALVIQKENFDTYTFTKKYHDDQEDPRIDFGFYNSRSAETDQLILKKIREALETSDVLIFNQQVPGSITNPGFIDMANALFDEFTDKKILLDTRHYNDRFRNIYRKTNDIEIARMNGVTYKAGESVPMKKIAEFGKKTFEQFHKPVFVTCGERGIMSFDKNGVFETPGIQFLCRLDPVGAGDTTLSALGLCLAAGVDPAEAAEFANLAAVVTVRKLFTTGTASGDEIIGTSLEPDYLFRPDLADDPGEANYLNRTRIEICDRKFTENPFHIRHALFDHDGTISTLRKGWESVMEKIMIDAITGGKELNKNGRQYSRIRDRVIDYIEKSTGVQTLIQMEALAEMVKEFGLVRPDDVLDKSGYKKIYNQALLDNMKERLGKIRKRPSAGKEFIIHGAVEFLIELKKRKVMLYLASGTDQEYVEEEAKTLGYGGLFEGRIYGATDDLIKSSKKTVIRNILKKNNLSGHELAVFGDGPIEIRESLRVGSLAVGIATDEEKMKGINQQKRSRLIKAGAHIVVPEFSDYPALLKLLCN
ncbi:MAG TPA: PfkB family carbohydrate kinase [Cyclobacteriaceae bacterium]|nr:PfkB family carbohydrate kinase [Cyclobacteriaceae bacterium]